MVTTMLEKMARALAAELERQIAPQVADHAAGKWGAVHSHFSGPSSIFGTCQINGEVDLTAALRAALLAIREPDGWRYRYSAESAHPFPQQDWSYCGPELPWEVAEAPEGKYDRERLISADAILNEKPETTTSERRGGEKAPPSGA